MPLSPRERRRGKRSALAYSWSKTRYSANITSCCGLLIRCRTTSSVRSGRRNSKNHKITRDKRKEKRLYRSRPLRRAVYFENLILWRGTDMANKKQHINSEGTLLHSIEISDKQIEIFARRLLPEIKRFFADEDIRREFEEWQRKRQDVKTE